MKYLAYSSFLFLVVCFGTSYAITKGALGRIPPTIFACGTMLLVLPVALVVCLLVRKNITRDVIRRGSLLGGCECAITLLFTFSLQYSSATATAFFPCLNGLIAAIFTRLVLRWPVARLTWCAAILALLGIGLMTASTDFSLDEWRGTLLALLGSGTCTGYIFLCEHVLVDYQTTSFSDLWPILGIQLLTMPAGTLIILLLFGDWSALHPEAKDLLAIPYDGVFVLLIPLLLAAGLQRFVDPISVAILSMLEPVLGALFALLSLRELFALSMYVGQSLVLGGVLLHTGLRVFSVSAGRSQDARSGRLVQHRSRHMYFLLHFRWRQHAMGAGLVTVLLLGGISAVLGWWRFSGVASSPSMIKTEVIVGYATFVSSGMLDSQNSHGINDGLELDLEKIARPAAGTAYYGWLLPDTEQGRQMPIFLGKLPISRGSAHLRYQDPHHTDLFAMHSRVLITSGPTHGPPLSPFLDHSTWRYYGQIQQEPASGVSESSHLLLHLRLLLISAPAMPGGLRLWFLTSTRSLLEGASASLETGGAEDPSFLRSDLSHMLVELDGSALAQQDILGGPPLSASAQTVQVPLLQRVPGQLPASSLVQISQQLVAILHDPDASPQQRKIATTVLLQLTEVEAAFQHVRMDARQLVAFSDMQLTQPMAQSLLNDLVEQTTAAFAGTVNPHTGEREGGSLWIADQLERLAAIPIEPCTPALCLTTSVGSSKGKVDAMRTNRSMAGIDRAWVKRKDSVHARRNDDDQGTASSGL